MLHVHHSSDADVLVDALADVLSDPLDDVFAIEQVAVHSRGLERWIAQRLSHRLGATDGAGACLAVEFPFPGRLVQRALAGAAPPTTASAASTATVDAKAAAGPDDGSDDPWLPDRLAWHLLRLLDRDPEVAAGTPLAAHLGGPRRFGAVRRVTTLFDRYAVHRPAMLRRWAAGDGACTADGRPLPGTHAWQATVWRALRDDVQGATGVVSPPERLAAAIDRLRDDPSVTDLPARVALFGLTALPSSYLDVVQALARHRDVHLFALHPSPALWRATLPVLAEADLADTTGTLPERGDDPTRALAEHPLVRSWARDSREMQLLLATSGATLSPGPLDPDTEVGGGEPRTLLARLQADARANAAPPGQPAPGTLDLRPALAPDDRSVQVHGCHGPARQVEVLRDLLLHRFASDDALQPRDVLVLCPDLTTYGPLLEATFGAAVLEGVDDRRLAPHRLRLRLADRALGGSNPLLRTTADLLGLVDGRVRTSDVRDLLVRPSVRAAFQLGDDELARVDEWLDGLGARWGLDGEHRAQHGVPTEAGTWRAALDRLLVGVAVADEDLRTVGQVVPFDDVATSDIDLVGRLAELVARLDHHLRALADPRPIDRWRDDVRAALDALTRVGTDEQWQRLQVDRLLDDAVSAATGADGTVARIALSLEEFRGLVRERLEAAGGGGSHRTGDLTVATLVPMRSVPHRVTVLLGMDEGAVPRPHRPDGDDLLDLDPRVGDRDPRTEDRQLLLDALLATRDELVVLFTSHHERTNEPVPPALPVSELLDVIDRTVSAVATDERSEPTAPSDAITTHHPLHATDPRNFRPGVLGIPDQPLGSDPLDLAGAQACLATTRDERPPFLAGPLEPLDDQGVLELPDLLRALRDPIGTLLADRFGLRFPREPMRASDELPLELGGLDRFAVGDRLLGSIVDGTDPRRALVLERGRGHLPPGELATPGVQAITDDLGVFRAVLTEYDLLGDVAPPVPIDLRIAGGRRLVGAIDGLCGTTLRSVGYRSLKEHARLLAWAQVVVLSAAHPEESWRAVTVARREQGQKDASVSVAVCGPLGDDPDQRRELATTELAWLVEFRDRAMTEAAPFAVASSCRYATTLLARRDGGRRSPAVAGASAWETSTRPGAPIPGEGDHGAQRLIHGQVPFARLLEQAARDDEQDPPWDDQEVSRFGRWALRAFEPMLRFETVEHR